MKVDSRSGRPISEKADEVLEKVPQDRHSNIADIGTEKGIYPKTIYRKKLYIWVPRDLIVKNMLAELTSAMRC